MALIEGDEGDNTLEGVADESNEIRGFGGDDTLTGANLADTILGGEGDDTIRGGAGGDLLASGPGSNTIFGEAGPDIIDLTEGLEGDTNLPSGGDDTDAFYAGAGSDIIDGGDGSDLVSYEFAAEGVVVLLGDGITDFGAAGDVLTTVEMLFGSDFDDILAGDDGENTINGGAGNDLIAGYGGFDFLDGGDGRDLIAFVQGAVRVDLAAGTASGADADGVTYTGFEGVYASPFDDRVSGDDGRNTLLGQEGDDKLHGRDGNDEIIGGIGDDSLLGGDGRDSLSGEDGDDRMLGGAGRDRQTGGGGADRFEFRALSDSGRPVAERDTIVDFSRKDGDSILLSRIDANDGRRGNQAFDFIGQDRFGGEAGELRYKKAGDHLTLLGDVDGDGRADLAVDVYGVGRMLAGDFVL